MYLDHGCFGVMIAIAIYPSLAAAQWCTENVEVVKTRQSQAIGSRYKLKNHWWGSQKLVTESFWYPTLLTYKSVETQRVCCQGYQLSRFKCEPICQSGCPPLATCDKPNVCICRNGYNLQNGVCEPVCTSCPPFSRCTAPNECSCEPGFAPKNNNCWPICAQKCPELATCTAPNVCSCQTGYAMQESTCRPVCGATCPEFSSCTSPNNCTCQSGYLMIQAAIAHTLCQPVCHRGCPLNAICTAPDRCECEVGYQFDKDGQCAAVCEPACLPHSHCLEPLRCTCESGYTANANNQSTGLLECSPVCSQGCPAYSFCAGHEACHCEEGYALQPHLAQCDPICSEVCPLHSTCLRPEECVCEEGYRLQRLEGHQPFCEAICPVGCGAYGKCVMPGKCECLSGYRFRESLALPNGTERINNHTPQRASICEPICANGCPNGLCFRPEQCVCNAGFLMGADGLCEPVCSLGCANGTCIEPEICQCLSGYALANGSVHSCAPLCDPACVNGVCMAPNVCICWPHYEPKGLHAPDHAGRLIGELRLDVAAASVCVPTCRQKCSNGNCTAPGVCSCHEGYAASAGRPQRSILAKGNEMNSGEDIAIDLLGSTIHHDGDFVGNICLPICSGCAPHGKCIRPGVCECSTGFTINPSSDDRKVVHCIAQYATTNELASTVTPKATVTPLRRPDTARITLLEPLQSAERCTDGCRCWIPADDDDDFGPTSNARCVRFCADAYDRPCIDLERCHCDAVIKMLLCNATDDASDENLDMHYICKVVMPVTTTRPPTHINVSPEQIAHGSFAQRANDHNWHYLAIGTLAALVICLAIAALGLVWHYYTRRPEIGQEAECMVSYTKADNHISATNDTFEH